ncbi:MAG TPA: cyanobactin class RiPP [Halomicronema sp.]
MDKKNLNPKQQKPVNRTFISKPISGLSEETLTLGWIGVSSSITPSMCPVMATSAELMGKIPFADDSAE